MKEAEINSQIAVSLWGGIVVVGVLAEVWVDSGFDLASS
jgi:hypothetical protein